MRSTLEHSSHPHTLELKENDVIEVDALCYGCNKPVIGSVTYTCVSHPDVDCENFYLHKSCAELPTKLSHHTHNRHHLVQRPFSDSMCNVSKIWFTSGWEYACETCSDFKIHIVSAFYPSRLKHKYDDHPVTLRNSLFFYEGVFYCEICEEQVNNQWWLYHCGQCDHSFHYNCIHWRQNVKLGGAIKLLVGNQRHTFALVIKWPARINSARYFCENCRKGYTSAFFFECIGCGILVCWDCVLNITCG